MRDRNTPWTSLVSNVFEEPSMDLAPALPEPKVKRNILLKVRRCKESVSVETIQETSEILIFTDTNG